MQGIRWPHKPPLGYGLDVEHPLAYGLVFYAPLLEGHGATTYDLVKGLPLAISTGTTWGAGVASGLACTSANTGAIVTTPAVLQLGLPLTIACGFRILGAASAASPVFGILSSSRVYDIEINQSLQLSLAWSSSNFEINHSPVTAGGEYVAVGTFAANAQSFAVNGIPTGTNTLSFTPSYAGSYVGIGTSSLTAFNGRTANVLLYWGALWNRVLSSGEIAALARAPYQVIEPRRILTYFGPIAVLGVPVYNVSGGSSGGIVGVTSPAYTVTVTTSGHADTITLSDNGAGGTFSPASLTFSGPVTPHTFTYTPVVTGALTLSLASTDGYTVTPSSVSYTSRPVPVNFTLRPPSSTTGRLGVASANFTVTPTSATTDTITFSDGASGTFTPSSLTFTASAAAQTFTYTPTTVGAKTLTLKSAEGGVVSGSPATFTSVPTTGSIRFHGGGACNFSTGSNNLLAGPASATVAFRVQFNTIAGAGIYPSGSLINKANVALLGLVSNVGQIGEFSIAMNPSAGGQIAVTPTIQPGIPYHVAISWQNGSQVIYLNGSPMVTGNLNAATYNYTGILQVGPSGTAPVDLQMSDLAIWDAAALDQTDVLNLYAGVYNPVTLLSNRNGGSPTLTKASAWFPMGGTLGNQPSLTGLGGEPDDGFLDWTGNGYAFTSFSGTASNAVYAGALGYAPGIETSAYVSKSGKLAMFFPVASTSPSPLSSSVIAATVNASNVSGYYPPQPVTAIGSNPTITWNGQTIEADGPTWTSNTRLQPFVAYRLQCGSVQSLGIANGGTVSYTSPAVAASGGGASSQATFGTPVLGTGIISYTLGGVGSYGQYTSLPNIAVAGGTFTKAPSARGVDTNGTITIVPAVGGILGCGSGVTIAPTYTLSGGVGAGATATATLSGSGIGSVAVKAAGAGYSSTTTTAHVVDTNGGTGSGATLTVSVNGSGVITGIAVNAAGSGYTKPVVVIQPGTGSGARTTATVGTTIDGGSGATATATVSGGGVTSLTITAGGSGYTSAPPAVLYGGGGTGGAAVLTISGGVVTGYAITNAGTGYTSAPTVLIGAPLSGTITVNTAGSGYGLGTTATVLDPTGTGATLSVTVTAGGVASIAVTAAGSGYTSPTVLIVDGAQASVTGNIGHYIQSVPVTSVGAGYTSPPTIAVTDSTGSGAMLTPVMSGVSSGDVLTYTAPWAWMQCLLGGAPSSPPPGSMTPASLVNYTGVLEGAAGLLPGFPSTTTMGLGLNAGDAQTALDTTTACFRNYAFKANRGWGGTGLVTTSSGQPYSCTPGTTLTNHFFTTDTTNPIDGKSVPMRPGTWSVVYTDLYAGTGNAVTVTLGWNGAVATPTSPTRTIVGTTVTVSYDIEYVANPATWAMQLVVNVAVPSGGSTWYWSPQIQNFTILPPNNTLSTTPLLGMDQNVVNWLTTSHSNTPAVMRFMDVCASYGGTSNYLSASDLPPLPTEIGWGQTVSFGATPGTTTDLAGTTIPSGNVTFTSYRRYITDPSKGSIASGGDGTYNWTITGRFYSSVWGGATAGANGGTDSFGPYLQLPPGDNGTIIYGLSADNGGVAAIELVSPTPHNLRTGQVLQVLNPLLGIPSLGNNPAINIGNTIYPVYVTGQYTIVITPVLNVTINSPTPAMVAATTAVPCSVGMQLQIPYGASVPFEFAAAMCSQIGSDVWISVPPWADAGCSLAIAQRVAANLTPGLKVYVEYANEHWNSRGFNYSACITMASLFGYLPAGVKVGNYYTTTGLPLEFSQFYTIWAAMHHDIWDEYFTSIGRPNSIVRIFGGFFLNAPVVRTMVAMATQYGIPMDGVHFAPYSVSMSDDLYVAACTPAGGVGTPGNWPMDAIIDLSKHALFYRADYWNGYGQSVPYMAAWGQPVTPATVMFLASTGGSLAVGYYFVYYTFVTAGGAETTVGNSQTLFYQNAAGYIYQVVLPPLPVWAASMNVYLTPVNSPAGTQVLYATGITGGTGAIPGAVTIAGEAVTAIATGVGGSGYTTPAVTIATYGGIVGQAGPGGATATATVSGGVITGYTVLSGGANYIYPVTATVTPGCPLSAAFTGGVAPPATNQVTPTHGLPVPMSYEFSPQELLPANTPFSAQLARDFFYHPAFYDLNQVCFASLQQGHPGVAGSGITTACFYQLTTEWYVNNGVWALAVSTAQEPGYGLSNQFATAQGGSPADLTAHDLTNQLPGLQAARDWWDASATPTPIRVARKKWFAGLRRLNARIS